MSKTLAELALELYENEKKVTLIYAFNGMGKTRLSREFKQLIAPQNADTENGEEAELSRSKILYYNAFTEDLFYWDNDLKDDTRPKLKIQPNTFTGWLIELLKELGEDGNIATNFQRYTGSKATPIFNEKYKTKDNDKNESEVTIPAFSEVTFQVAANEPVDYETPTAEDSSENNVVQGKYEVIKISKGEESNFVWSVMYTLLQQVISTLNEPDITDRITDKFDDLEYVFIDDPVSSLDDSHLIELAVDLAGLIKSSTSGLKFVISTHSPLFYNVLSNEFNNKLAKVPNAEPIEWIYKPRESVKFRLDKKADGTLDFTELDRKTPFSYHLLLLREIREAIGSEQIKKYHFSFLRNILEKTATFLGHDSWENLLPKADNGNPDPFANRILNLSSHSAHAGEETGEVEANDKEKLENLVNFLASEYGFWKQEA